MPTEGRVLQRRRDKLLALARSGKVIKAAAISGRDDAQILKGRVNCVEGFGGRQYYFKTRAGTTIPVYIREVEGVNPVGSFPYDSKTKVSLAFNVIDVEPAVKRRADNLPQVVYRGEEMLEAALA